MFGLNKGRGMYPAEYELSKRVDMDWIGRCGCGWTSGKSPKWGPWSFQNLY